MRYIYTSLFLLIFQLGNTQIDTLNLTQKAQTYLDAFISKDFKSMAQMTHPNIVTLSGGIDWVQKDLEMDRAAMDNLGFKYLKGTVGSPGEVHKSGEELLCFVAQDLILEVDNKKYKAEIPLLASSTTKGESWTFITLDRYDAKGIKDFIPSYREDMGWPETKNMELIQSEKGN